jgi:hypothetical protein
VLVCGKDLICRVAEFEKRVEAVSLRPWQWELLLAFDGQASLAEVAREAGIDMPIACDAVRSLHEQGLVFISTMRIEEYRRGAAPPIALPLPLPLPPPQSEAPLPPMPAAPSAGGVAFSLKAPPPPKPSGFPAPPSTGSIGFKIK